MTAERAGRAPWIEGAALAAAVLLVLVLGGEAVRASYHGFLHATVGEAVLRDGLSPENPYHAGEPLRYYVLYPALGVLLGRSGLGPLWGFALLNVLAALLTGPALDALGRGLGLRFGARRAAFAGAVLGFNALGWLGFFLVKVVGVSFGDPPFFVLKPMTLQGYGFAWDPRLQAFLPKYLNVSSFALALPFAFWALAEAARVARGDARPFRAVLPAALALALNPVVGGVSGLCMAIWVAPALLRGAPRQRLAWPLAGGLAIALALPFLLPAFHAAPRGPELTGGLAFSGTTFGNLLGPLLLLLPLGLLGAGQLAPGARWRWAAAAGLAALLVLVGEMPWQNEYKLARLGGFLWALPAGAWAGAWWSRRRGAARWLPAVLAVLAAPTTGVTAWAYLAWGRAQEGPPYRVVRGRLEPDPDRVQAAPPVELLRRGEPGAVLLLDLLQPGTRLGTASLVHGNLLGPALDRPLFVDRPHTLNDRLPDLGLRLDTNFALWHGTTWPVKGEGGQMVAQAFDRAAALRRLREAVADRSILVLTHRSAAVLLPGDQQEGQTAAEAVGRKVQVLMETLRAAGAEPADAAGNFLLWRLPALRP